MNKFFRKMTLLIYPFLISTSIIVAQSQSREVAITIDDLPVASGIKDNEFQQKLTTELLAKLKKNNVPAIGFVNEGKLFRNDSLINERVDLLKQWLDTGLELGNHTYSHNSLNQIPAKDYIEDIVKGEKTIRGLIENSGKELTYFRHPFLHTGTSKEVRDSVENFLKEHNYIIAPVTIDNSDWVFARGYEKAFLQNDSSMMKKISDEYISYMVTKFEHFEFVSRELFGREIKQILLIHASKLNADHFNELAESMIKRGYKFISIKEALEDSAYNSPDTFYKNNGISWLHRWAITEGRNKDIFKTDYPVPEYIMKYAEVESE
jgi:peptidoglycan/xylan/chitin deacetylase (PgdA/CDA1 family)